MNTKTLINGILLFLLTLPAQANASESSSDRPYRLKAVELAKNIEGSLLVTKINDDSFSKKMNALDDRQKVDLLRTTLMDTLGLRNSLNSNKWTSEYRRLSLKINDNRNVSLSKLYQLYEKHRDSGGEFKSFSKFKADLEPYLNHSDWVISHRANVFLSKAESYSLDLNTSLSNALDAYDKIPNEKSIYVDEAVIESLDLIAYLHNLLNNPEMAVEATEKLIRKRLENGQEIDGISLINNLIYSFGKWQDFETTSKLAETLVALDTQSTSSIIGLSELRLAQTLNDKGDYQAALDTIVAVKPQVEHKTVKANLIINCAVALAGLGRVEDAEILFSAYKKFKAEISLDSENLKDRELMAEALIAKSKGDMETAFAKMQERYTVIVQRILTSNNSSTAKQLANLEASKARQAERETALRREADLKQQKLDQQKRVNLLLMTIAGLLALATILALLFARFRNRVSKELAIKTLQAEDADRMKSEFLGMVSHELRTPLNGIVGIADLLSNQAPTEDLRHKAGIILDSSNKLTHVVESIVDMSRIDGEKMELYPEPTEVYDIITELDQLWRPVIEEKGVTFTQFTENSLADEVILDKARFRQCLNSLLSNASKFTDTGRVHLHVTSKPTEIENQVEITAIIADTGQGMSEEVQGKLFTPFLQADSSMTRKHGGSGLGLAITQSLARMMDGDVTMVSNLNRGSEFTLTVKGQRSESSQILDDVEALMDSVLEKPIETNLVETAETNTQEAVTIAQTETPEYAPIQAVETSDSDISANVATPAALEPELVLTSKSEYDAESLRGLNVLIVDDIPANHDVIKLFLNPEGCESHAALNGIEALQVLETQAIDIILMDIRMPDMDGIEATRTIRNSNRHYKNIPIIALTADVSAETNAACMSAGADIFLTKPVMARDLIESIKFIRRFQDYEEETAANVA